MRSLRHAGACRSARCCARSIFGRARFGRVRRQSFWDNGLAKL